MVLTQRGELQSQRAVDLVPMLRSKAELTQSLSPG